MYCHSLHLHTFFPCWCSPSYHSLSSSECCGFCFIFVFVFSFGCNCLFVPFVLAIVAESVKNTASEVISLIFHDVLHLRSCNFVCWCVILYKTEIFVNVKFALSKNVTLYAPTDKNVPKLKVCVDKESEYCHSFSLLFSFFSLPSPSL